MHYFTLFFHIHVCTYFTTLPALFFACFFLKQHLLFITIIIIYYYFLPSPCLACFHTCYHVVTFMFRIIIYTVPRVVLCMCVAALVPRGLYATTPRVSIHLRGLACCHTVLTYHLRLKRCLALLVPYRLCIGWLALARWHTTWVAHAHTLFFIMAHVGIIWCTWHQHMSPCEILLFDTGRVASFVYLHPPLCFIGRGGI